MRAKTKTAIKSKKEKPFIRVTPEKVLADGGLFDAVVILCAVFNRKPRRPFVRQATIDGVKQLATMLVAQDGDLQELKQLLDKDATESSGGLSTTGQLVQPPKRKKAVRRR
jgi:hypothetical protein